MWPTSSLLVSPRDCCLRGKAKHQRRFRRRSEPQTFWFLLSVSYLGLLLQLSEECLFMSLALKGTSEYFQSDIRTLPWNN